MKSFPLVFALNMIVGIANASVAFSNPQTMYYFKVIDTMGGEHFGSGDPDRLMAAARAGYRCGSQGKTVDEVHEVSAAVAASSVPPTELEACYEVMCCSERFPGECFADPISRTAESTELAAAQAGAACAQYGGTVIAGRAECEPPTDSYSCTCPSYAPMTFCNPVTCCPAPCQQCCQQACPTICQQACPSVCPTPCCSANVCAPKRGGFLQRIFGRRR